MKWTRNIAITMVCVILGVMLAWQYKSINYNQKMVSYQNKRVEEIKDELIIEKRNSEELRKRLDELLRQNEQYESIKGNIDEETRFLKTEIIKSKTIAGLTEVKGKGVIVTIDKSEFINVEDSDILNVLNELKASGAQAISVNDERIVAVSEIRAAGKYIMINGRQMLPPFVIKAIADPEKLEHSLKMIGGVVERLEAYQLKVGVERFDNIIIPRVRDEVIKTDLLVPAK